MAIEDNKQTVFEKRLNERKDIYVKPRDLESRKSFVEVLESKYGMICDNNTTKQEVIDSRFPITIIYKYDPSVYTSSEWNTTTAACAMQSGVVFSEEEFLAYFRIC